MSKKRRAAKKSRQTTRVRRVRKRPAKGAARGSLRASLAAATNKRKAVPERISAMATLPVAADTSGESLESLLDVLEDRDEPIDVRLAALQSLGAARFASAGFASIERDYIATLRAVADDPDHELRQRVLGILAREKDGFAQQRLLEGLQNPERALVAPEKALQLLGYDVHADAYPIARDIVRNPPNPEARREALRLLAADAASAPAFESILRDKREASEIRQISAAALNAIDPGKLQAHAREMLLDPAENEELRATSLMALSQYAPTVAMDQPLIDRVNQLTTDPSEQVQDSARRLLRRVKREGPA